MTGTKIPENSLAIRLNCIGGEEAPAEIGADLQVLSGLPERARERFWDALFPALAEPLPPSAAQALDAFARSFGLSDDTLSRALRACRFLVREACARDLSRAHFEEDVVRLLGGPLSPDAVVIAPLLLLRYEEAKRALRGPMMEATVSDHGALLESLEWRVDTILSSSRGDALNVRVALLTLGYRQGDKKERITLQLSRQRLEELKRACEAMLR